MAFAGKESKKSEHSEQDGIKHNGDDRAARPQFSSYGINNIRQS